MTQRYRTANSNSRQEKKWMRGPLFSLEPEAVDALANSLAKRAMKLQVGLAPKVDPSTNQAAATFVLFFVHIFVASKECC